MNNAVITLNHDLKKAEGNLLLIKEKIAEYVMEEDVPLQLTKNERQWIQRIDQLRSALRDAENRELQTLATCCATGSKQLLDNLGVSHPAYRIAQRAGEHLVANIHALRVSRQDHRDERSKLVVVLNRLAMSVLNISFGRLCGVPNEALLVPLTALHRALVHVQPAIKIPEQVESSSVRQGIGALVDLTRNPAVHEIVLLFHADIQVARERVGTLIYFKDLHDQLHRLQYLCYNPIVRDARSFPEVELVRESLADYEMTMREIVRALHDIVVRTGADVTIPSWIGEIEQSVNLFRLALDTADAKTLARTIWMIDRVLTTQPVYINVNLIATARTLPLPTLVDTLRRLRAQLITLSLDKVKMDLFESGVESLSNMSQKLNELLQEHDDWQYIERELRRIEASLRLDTIDIEMSWADLNYKVEALCNVVMEEWSQALKRDGSALHIAIAEHDQPKVREAFRRYRRQAGDRFFRVDTDLKRLFDRLRQFEDPFIELLRVSDLQRAVG